MRATFRMQYIEYIGNIYIVLQDICTELHLRFLKISYGADVGIDFENIEQLMIFAEKNMYSACHRDDIFSFRNV